MKITIIKIKKYFYTILFTLFIICLLIFPTSPAAKSGLDMFLSNIFPSLFPFFVASKLLTHTNLIQILTQKLNKYIKPLFNVSGSAAYPIIMGIISGYPTGAKIVTDMRNQKILSKEESERLLAYTNNSGPMFILGTVGAGFFLNKRIGLLLLITHILGTFTTALIFKSWKSNKRNTYSTQIQYVNISNIGEILGESIKESISSLLTIGGFVILFSVIISIIIQSNILKLAPNEWIKGLILGTIEMTNGIKYISSITNKTLFFNIILSSFLLGLGGLSVFFQIFSITSKSDLSIKPYLLGKITHALSSAIYTYIALFLYSKII